MLSLLIICSEILDTMFDCVKRGLEKEGTIPGKLQLPRVAKQMYTQAINLPAGSERETLILSSYAYAVAEENASGRPSLPHRPAVPAGFFRPSCITAISS